MKKWWIALALTSSLALVGCQQKDDIIVETKYGSMTESEFYEKIKALAGTELLEQIVMDTILSENYTVTDEEIDVLYTSYEEQYGDSFADVLASYGYTDETFRDSLRMQALQEKALQDVDITDAQIEQYYEQAKYELQARHILVDTEEEALAVMERLNNGEAFEEVAKEVSTDTTSGENGGSLDWFTVGAMVQEFNDAAYALEVGTRSDIVATDYGYHIIELLDRREVADYGTLEEQRETIRTTLQQQAAATTEWADVEARLVQEAEVSVKDEALQNAFQ